MILRNCLLTLRSLPKNLTTKIPCFVSLPDAKVNIVNCELMGTEHAPTAGCLFFNSEVVMSSTKFKNFKSGAVYSIAESSS